ncbi:hypothetical protein IAT38_003727 [Cryptococcus sp. DSM 104549]
MSSDPPVASQPEGTYPPSVRSQQEPQPHNGHQYFFKRLSLDRPLPSKRLLACMVTVLFTVMFLVGWNDASQGPLLPSLQTYYSVNFLVISILWVTNFIGFLIAGLSNVWISDHFGFGIAAPFGATVQAIAYSLMCWGGPFPLFLIAFILNGFGVGLQDAQVNSLTSRLPGAATKMFLMHAFYGFGATVSPLVSTAFVQNIPDTVYYYFAVSLGLALIIAVALLCTFRLRTEDQIVGKRGQEEREGEEGEAEAEMTQEKSDSGDKVKRMMRTPVVHFMAFYMVIYVGVEITIGGWATSFLLEERGGSDSSGYVSTGYFAGITLGRIALIPVSHLLGPHRSILLYTLGSIALSLVIWFTHTVIGNAICFAIVGIFLGPIYPLVINVVVDVVPPDLQNGSIGWIASLGQAGSAIMPFIAGAISEKYGVWILQPFIVAFLGASLFLWLPVIRAGHSDRPFWHIPKAVTSAIGEKERLRKEAGSGPAGGKQAAGVAKAEEKPESRVAVDAHAEV